METLSYQVSLSINKKIDLKKLIDRKYERKMFVFIIEPNRYFKFYEIGFLLKCVMRKQLKYYTLYMIIK